MLKFYVIIIVCLGIGRFFLTMTYGAPTSGGDAIALTTTSLLALAILKMGTRINTLESKLGTP